MTYDLKMLAKECAGVACLCHNNCKVEKVDTYEYGEEQIYDILCEHLSRKDIIFNDNMLKSLETIRDHLETSIYINDNQYYNNIMVKLMTYLDAISDMCEEVITFDIINNWDNNEDLHLQLKIYFEKKPNDYIMIGKGV